MSDDPSYVDEVRLDVQVHETEYELIEEAKEAWKGIQMAPDEGQVELNFGPEPHRFELWGVNTKRPTTFTSPAGVDPAIFLMGKAVQALQNETDCLVEEVSMDGRDRPYEYYFDGIYDKR